MLQHFFFLMFDNVVVVVVVIFVDKQGKFIISLTIKLFLHSFNFSFPSFCAISSIPSSSIILLTVCVCVVSIRVFSLFYKFLSREGEREKHSMLANSCSSFLHSSQFFSFLLLSNKEKKKEEINWILILLKIDFYFTENIAHG